MTHHAISQLLDEVANNSHNHRTWIGKLSERLQRKHLGQYFGTVTLRICEAEATISELRKTKHGYIKHNGAAYEVRSVYSYKRPMSSKFDKASRHARSAIITLMTEHRYKHAPEHPQHIQ